MYIRKSLILVRLAFRRILAFTSLKRWGNAALECFFSTDF